MGSALRDLTIRQRTDFLLLSMNLFNLVNPVKN